MKRFIKKHKALFILTILFLCIIGFFVFAFTAPVIQGYSPLLFDPDEINIHYYGKTITLKPGEEEYEKLQKYLQDTSKITLFDYVYWTPQSGYQSNIVRDELPYLYENGFAIEAVYKTQPSGHMTKSQERAGTTEFNYVIYSLEIGEKSDEIDSEFWYVLEDVDESKYHNHYAAFYTTGEDIITNYYCFSIVNIDYPEKAKQYILTHIIDNAE